MPAKDAKDARQAVSNIMSGGLNATEAIARGFGLKSHVEQRAEREAALKVCPTLFAATCSMTVRITDSNVSCKANIVETALMTGERLCPM